MIKRLPGLGESADQIQALIELLSAPREDLERLADDLGLVDLVEVPAVGKAPRDDEYFKNIQQLSRC